ncbi:MAG: transcription antitermination factor NusB [Chitinophagaceae bacterium]|nr:transcription antitermination factor NusB [Chitinophagaceae bacterium]NDB53328.1 transcription antitermination factor NusB [Chitinophagaceae bacterium]
MISRRNIRIKVMQVLYGITTFEENPAPAKIHELLDKQLAQTRQLFVYLTWFLTQVLRYTETYAFKKASKHLPTQEDLNVNTKLAGNELLWLIIEKPDFQKQVATLKPENRTDAELIRKIHSQLIETETYQNYLQDPARQKREERSIMEFILNDLLLANPSFIAHIEELYSNFDDDAESVVQLLGSLLQKPSSVSFDTIIDPEKEKFAQSLLKTVLEKDKHLESLIIPKLKNWDPDRIALLDMIMMKMGVAEFLYFETIPPKVTLNEYIDMAKDYSTTQSGQFVNGILDNIRKELEEEGKLQKTDFKKSTKATKN